MTEILSEKQALERLESAAKKAEALNSRIIRLQAKKEQNDKQLSELEDKATKEFGTCDLDEMRNIYRERAAKQTAAIVEYETRLGELTALVDHIEKELEQIEQKYA